MRKIISILPILAILLVSGCVAQPSGTPNDDNNNDDQSYTYQIFGSRSSIGDKYHTMIDRYNPSYILLKKTDCSIHNGDWYDEDYKIGCFDINIPYDSTLCNTDSVIQFLKGICDTIDSARWVCDSRQVGCYYP